jgi:hypothetical protein
MIGMMTLQYGSQFMYQGEVWTCIAVDVIDAIANAILEMEDEDVQKLQSERGLGTMMFALENAEGRTIGAFEDELKEKFIFFNQLPPEEC